jgi:hypothetical protein
MSTRQNTISVSPRDMFGRMAASVLRPQRSLRSNSDLLLRSGKRIKAARSLTDQEAPGVLKKPWSDHHHHPAVLDLPEELLEAILPYLHTKDLCGLAQACHRLNAVAVRTCTVHKICCDAHKPCSSFLWTCRVIEGS